MQYAPSVHGVGWIARGWTGLLVGWVMVLGQQGATAEAWKGFLQIDGITGESKDAQHVGWINVGGVDAGVAPLLIVPGQGAGKPLLLPIIVSHDVDRSSPDLYLAMANGRLPVANGKGIAKARLQLFRITKVGATNAFVDIQLSGVSVSGLQTYSGTAGYPLERVSLSYSGLTFNSVIIASSRLVSTPAGGVSAALSVSAISSPSPAMLPVSIEFLHGAVGGGEGRVALAWTSPAGGAVLESAPDVDGPWVAEKVEASLDPVTGVTRCVLSGPTGVSAESRFWRVRPVASDLNN